MSLTCTFTTTKWVINRVHCLTTNCWANTTPSVTTSFTKLCVHAFFVTNNTDCCVALSVYTAKFTRWELDCYVFTVNTSYLCTSTCRANKLSTATKCKFNIVNCETYRNCVEWKCISNCWSCIFTRHDLLTNCKLLWSNNVTLFTISVCNQSNVCTAEWIVFDCLYCSRNTVLIASKVDFTILSLVTATLVTNGNTSALSTSSASLATRCEAFFGFVGCNFFAYQVNTAACTL